jgi:hypothetical protein
MVERGFYEQVVVKIADFYAELWTRQNGALTG